MKRLCIFAMALCMVVACNKGDEFVDTNKSEIDVLIGEQQGLFDDSGLALLLSDAVLNLEYIEDSCSGAVLYRERRIVFNEDGTCYVICHDDMADESLLLPSEYFYSRTYSWTYDEGSKVITTIDEYGNASKATVIYLDGHRMAYTGAIADMMISVCDAGSECRTLVSFTDDRSWEENELLSYDVHFRGYPDKNDKRLNSMLELIANSDGDVDDELFSELIKTKVMYFGRDIDGTESGSVYGDVGVYYSLDNVLYYSDRITDGGFEPSIYVMMEDGSAKSCFVYDGLADPAHPLVGEKCFIECEWSYDANSNTLYTNKSAAEVLYCDKEIAILRGTIEGVSHLYDYCLFYIDFAKLDRKSTLDDYSTPFVL